MIHARFRAAVGILACLVAVSRAAAGEDYDRYYKVLMDNQAAGWMRLQRVSEGDTVTTTREMRFELARGEVKSTANMKTRFVETPAGKPVSMRSEMAMGANPVVVEYTFGPADVLVINNPEGSKKETRAPLPAGEWLTPSAAAQFVRKRLAGGAKEISYRTIDPLSGLGVETITLSAITRDRLQVGDRALEGYRMKSASSGSPGVVGEDFVDLEGSLVSQTAGMGGLVVTTILAGPEVVDQKVEAPELMVSTFVRPDRPIMDARRVSKATFVLDYSSKDAPSVPETGSQTTTAADGQRLTVLVDASMPFEAPAKDWDNQAYRLPSALLTSEDPKVIELARRAVREIPEDQVHARAEAIRGAVHRHIRKKDLSIGFASAADTVASGQGDCTEHAVLLAAALRAAGIPSRVAGGLIYADQFAGSRDIFGYHMWAQALIQTDAGLRWVDLDATLDPPGYDATHLALVTSAMSDDLAARELLGIAAAMGRLSISVVEVEHRR
ncbi:MAG: hypothetical protein AMXMBFR58_08520 [Phycisphaerae bacterium]